ncbi:MAG TPA: HPr-rel-A system PqqD family peptide chaperone [Alphaproteobacteria bacterium]|nr:HPr-rel-A system PqqD family peptide chaperone [Alphaproteobacteria bacterium]
MSTDRFLYRIAGDSHLLWRRWDHDEALVYHEASGRTHLVDALSAEALMQLQAGPMTMDALTEAIRRQHDIETDDLQDRLLGVCQSLLAIGLIDES